MTITLNPDPGMVTIMLKIKFIRQPQATQKIKKHIHINTYSTKYTDTNWANFKAKLEFRKISIAFRIPTSWKHKRIFEWRNIISAAGNDKYEVV